MLPDRANGVKKTSKALSQFHDILRARTGLIDELTYSAGILFATTMQDLKLARLVGRPTGGFANQTGNMMPTRLPGTGFTAFIATRDFIRPSGDERVLPVLPDLLLLGELADAEFIRRTLL